MKNLKKSILAVAAAAALSTSAMAGTVNSNMSVGYSYVDLGSGITGNGASLGYDVAIPLDGEKIPVKGFEAGLGVNVDMYSMSDSSTVDSSLAGMNGELTLGYRFLQDKAVVKGGIGYGYLSVNSDLYLTGMQYSTAVDYKINQKFGVEGIYTYSSLSPSVGSGNFDTNKYGVNLLFKF